MSICKKNFAPITTSVFNFHSGCKNFILLLFFYILCCLPSPKDIWLLWYRVFPPSQLFMSLLSCLNSPLATVLLPCNDSRELTPCIKGVKTWRSLWKQRAKTWHCLCQQRVKTWRSLWKQGAKTWHYLCQQGVKTWRSPWKQGSENLTQSLKLRSQTGRWPWNFWDTTGHCPLNFAYKKLGPSQVRKQAQGKDVLDCVETLLKWTVSVIEITWQIIRYQ